MAPRKTTKKKHAVVGPRTRVWDRQGLWGEYQIGSDRTTSSPGPSGQATACA